jgi:hypothetical protein
LAKPPRLPLFFHLFPATKTVGGDKGVGVEQLHNESTKLQEKTIIMKVNSVFSVYSVAKKCLIPLIKCF